MPPAVTAVVVVATIAARTARSAIVALAIPQDHSHSRPNVYLVSSRHVLIALIIGVVAVIVPLVELPHLCRATLTRVFLRSPSLVPLSQVHNLPLCLSVSLLVSCASCGSDVVLP